MKVDMEGLRDVRMHILKLFLDPRYTCLSRLKEIRVNSSLYRIG